jgi:hypothetical protein
MLEALHMKLNVQLASGHNLNFEGTYDELVRISHEFARQPKTSAPPLPDPDNAGWSAKTAQRLRDKLFGDQQKLISYLVSVGGTATSSQIEEQLGLAKHKLAGVLSAITRNAQNATGDRAARLVAWRGSADNQYVYYIVPEALPYMTESYRPQEAQPAS